LGWDWGSELASQYAVAQSVPECNEVEISGWRDKLAIRLAGTLAATVVISALLVFCVELIARGSLSETLQFFQQPFKPGWTTVLLFSLLLLFLDALLGRAHHALLLVAPLVLVLAFLGHQKSLYLGDPLYPTDILFARQIVELMPLLASDRPLAAVAIALGAIVAIAVLALAWKYWRRRPTLTMRGRLLRLAATLPLLAFFCSIMDYATFSWARDRLQIIPMMWDQKENYNSNGFALAFALNMPMAKVVAPAGYSAEAIEAITRPDAAAPVLPDQLPDIIVVMNESFWDPTLLPGITITPDPIANVRSLKSGHIFSPEFGGMTANVEFEALTGFSNAFLPYGSIPYQQYVRSPIPSLASFLRSEGYDTRAFHPFGGWFWNRTPVYKAFGFERFMSLENLPPLAARGPLVSDAALIEELIHEADTTHDPLFFFAVTLQNHGPYAPGRYPDATHTVSGSISDAGLGSILSYAEGAADGDQALARLVEWARKRDRHTIIAMFGDHLPPLGPVYVETGFMDNNVAKRRAPLPEMSVQHETPLVVWSNRSGPQHVGSISPAFLPFHLMETAGISHPYYTGFLGGMRERYRVIDRNMLVSTDDVPTPDWSQSKGLDPAIRDFRLLQYDMIFGRQHAAESLFPEMLNAPAAM
jgi:phosphoglycerol transferase MdoB-like AlkP superfamily enzyme